MATASSWQHLPLPTLTVSRMDQLKDWQPNIGVQTKRWTNGKKPQAAVKKGGGAISEGPKRKVLARPQISIEETLNMRRNFSQMYQSRSSPLLSIATDTLGKSLMNAPKEKEKVQSVPSIPRTATPTPVYVSVGAANRQSGWASLLMGSPKIELPAQLDDANECVSWYRRRELENRCAMPSLEAREEASNILAEESPTPAQGSRWALQDDGTQSLASPSTISRSPTHSINLTSSWQPLPPEVLQQFGRQAEPEVSVWVQKAKKLASWRLGLTERPSAAHEQSIQQRMKLFHILEKRDVQQCLDALRFTLRLRFGSIEKAFRILDVGERGDGPSLQEMSGGLALLGLDVPSLCGEGEYQVFRQLDVDRDGHIGLEDLRGTSVPPSTYNVGRNATDKDVLSAIAGDLSSWENDHAVVEDPEAPEKWTLFAKFVALSAWFDTPPVTRQRGRPDVEKAGSFSFSLALNSLDRDKFAANKSLMLAVTDLLKEHVARVAKTGTTAAKVSLRILAATLLVEGSLAYSSLTAADYARLNLKTSRTLVDSITASVQNVPGIDTVCTGIISISGFRVSPVSAMQHASQQKLQSATPSVKPPGIGTIGHGPPTGTADLCMKRFDKVSASAIPDGWRLATHMEVREKMSDVLLLMGDWDVCGLAGGWRFDGAGYGHNLKEPYGPANFSTVIVCRDDVNSPQARKPIAVSRNVADTNSSQQLQRGGSEAGALEKQQALDGLRQCWSPNENDYDDAKRVLQLQFLATATGRQFGEPLLTRIDIKHLLGKMPPPGLPKGHPCPTLLEIGELFDEALEMQVVVTSKEGRALTKGLTFESLRFLLQNMALRLGLHFRHIVDDAVESKIDLAKQ